MRKLLAYIRLATIDSIFYRGDMILWAVGLLIQPVVYLLVWLAVISAGGKPPLSRDEFIQYYLAILLIRTWANVWASGFISADIRLGRLSPFLLRPAPYIFYQLGNNIGGKVIKSAAMLIAVILLLFLFSARIPSLNVVELIAFLASWFIAGTILFFIDISIGIISFWTNDSTSVDELTDAIGAIFSGQIVPLVIFPPLMQSISTLLPFRYTLSFPIEILQNKLTAQGLAIGIGFEIFWLSAFILLYKFLWKYGVKRYSAVGA